MKHGTHITYTCAIYGAILAIQLGANHLVAGVPILASPQSQGTHPGSPCTEALLLCISCPLAYRLETVPPGLAAIGSLTSLDLSDNDIANVPGSMSALTGEEVHVVCECQAHRLKAPSLCMRGVGPASRANQQAAS